MTTRAKEVATVDGECFRGSEGFRSTDDIRRGLKMQQRQMARPPEDTTKTLHLNRKAIQQLNPQPPKPSLASTVKIEVDDGAEIIDWPRWCRDFKVKISRKFKPKLVRPAAEESGRAATAAEAGPTSGGEDCGGDEAEGGGWGILRAATARFDHADGGARTAEGGATPIGGGAGPSTMRRGGTDAAARGGSTSGGLEASNQRRATGCLGGGSSLARDRCGDGSRAMRRCTGGGSAGLRRWSRRVSDGGRGRSPAVVAGWR
ncbi:hypothetical protein Syun_004779 [Stephania yunnanensis]|uniref:Uncharacterized protein n=1 Tax=Stephania yunnanensis TaxID=152371 RepID=A0AAP0L550_9MAGN